jgi:hypothetical protein
MIHLVDLREKVSMGIENLHVPQLNKTQNALFKQYCVDIMQESNDLNTLLSLTVLRVNELSDPMDFLKQVTSCMQDIVRPHINNEFRFILGEHFEPDEDADLVSKEYIQSVFIKNLISILNNILVKAIDDTSGINLGIAPVISKQVHFSIEAINTSLTAVVEHPAPKPYLS